VKLILGLSTDVKFRMYSAHDSNLARWMKVLNPTYDFNSVVYASTLHFQVYKKD
jgi:hypothetical protein